MKVLLFLQLCLLCYLNPAIVSRSNGIENEGIVFCELVHESPSHCFKDPIEVVFVNNSKNYYYKVDVFDERRIKVASFELRTGERETLRLEKGHYDYETEKFKERSAVQKIFNPFGILEKNKPQKNQGSFKVRRRSVTINL